MLLVKTRIGPSKIHGIGVFAAEYIPKGKVIWEITPGFDIELSEKDIDDLPLTQREQVKNYSFLSTGTGKFVFCADDGRFFNHSESPNTIDKIDSEKEETVAARDIEENEELIDKEK